MLNPYFLMALLYLVVAALAALDASLISFDLASYFIGIRWLRIHFITLGMMTQTLFGVLPILVTVRRRLPRPPMRWDIWLALNVGLIILLAGIPSLNQPLILVGGSLIFIAAVLLGWQLWRLPHGHAAPIGPSARFYLTGSPIYCWGLLSARGCGWVGVARCVSRSH